MTLQIAMGLTKLGILTALLIIFASEATNAQTHDYGLRANIPFAFKVGDKTLPAGHYLFKRARQNDDLVLQVSSVKGESTVFRNTIPATTLKAKDTGLLIFHRYNDEYFLSQVWPAGELTGRALPASRNERQLQRGSVDPKVMSKMEHVGSETVTVVAY